MSTIGSADLFTYGGTIASAGPVQCGSLRGAINGVTTIARCSPSGGSGYRRLSGSAAVLFTGGSLIWECQRRDDRQWAMSRHPVALHKVRAPRRKTLSTR